MANKILIVDDEADLRETVKGFLQDRGYAAISACDGDDGLKKFDEESPEMVLLDLRMPKKDGYEFLKHIRENKDWVPVVIISAMTEPKDVFKGYEYEADYYLTKPIDLENLLKVVQIMLSLIPLRKK